MGCLHVCNRLDQNEHSDSFKIFQAVNLSSIRRLKTVFDYISAIHSLEYFDSLMIEYQNISINALGLCFLKGKTKLFQLLLSNGCCIKRMENLLEKFKISPIHYLCAQGDLAMLEIYFPHYLERNMKKSEESNSTLALTPESTVIDKGFPIHTAAHYGNANIINFFHRYFSGADSIPTEFSINSIEDHTGENCALIACREGHYKLVVDLHENYNSNITKLNHSKENAIMIAIIGMNNNPSYAYFDIIEYLIDTVKINLNYMHEQILKMAQFSELIEYLEEKMQKEGIKVNKKDVKQYELPGNHINYERDDKIGTIFTNSFFDSMEKEADKSIPSTILYYESLSIEDKSIEGLFK